MSTPMPTIGSAITLIFSLRPSNDTIQPVVVVPRLAPKITPTAAVNGSRPALTNPMVASVVALEDCTRAVIPAPDSSALNGPPVKLVSQRRSESPAAAFKPSVSRIMPSRNRPNPPINAGSMSPIMNRV